MADSKEKKASLRVDVQDSELTYSCEWGECEEQFNDIPDFLRHIGGHIWNLVSTVTTEEKGFSCGWRDCGTQILGDKHDFNRHVYFHAFHVKLKCVGAVVIKKTRYPVCTIDGQSRNWIPELPESLQCGWTSCGAVCDNPVIFYNHVAHHCEEYPNGNNIKGGCLCRWTDCDARFKSKHKLREHLRSHTQEKVVACPTCGGLFASRTKLFDHLTRQKETVDSWQDNPDFVQYLVELSSCGVERLSREPDRLAEEKSQILSETQDLAFHNYTTFIHTADCSKEIFQDFQIIEKHVDNLLTKLPPFSDECQNVVKKAQEISSSRRMNTLTLQRHTQLLEVLEMPQLMDTCVRNGYYEEALELAAHVRRLEKKHAAIPVIMSIVEEVKTSTQLMLNQLIHQLRTNLQLPACLRVIGFLRRMDVFTEAELRIKFLQARDSWFQGILEAVPRDDPYAHITKTIELSRVHLFDIITQYRAIFSDEDPLLTTTRDETINEAALFHGWVVQKVSHFLSTLEIDLQHGVGGRLDSLLGQCMYFGLSFSRVGADFRGLLPPIFKTAALQNFKAGLKEANTRFEENMQSYNLLGVTSAGSGINYGSSTQPGTVYPPTVLLEFYPLAAYCNHVLTAFNDLRLCAPVNLACEIADCVQQSLLEVNRIILAFFRAEETTFNLQEGEQFGQFCATYITDLLPYLNKCLQVLFPASQLAQALGVSVTELHKLGSVGQVDLKAILKQVNHLIPVVKESPTPISSSTVAPHDPSSPPNQPANKTEISVPKSPDTTGTPTVPGSQDTDTTGTPTVPESPDTDTSSPTDIQRSPDTDTSSTTDIPRSPDKDATGTTDIPKSPDTDATGTIPVPQSPDTDPVVHSDDGRVTHADSTTMAATPDVPDRVPVVAGPDTSVDAVAPSSADGWSNSWGDNDFSIDLDSVQLTGGAPAGIDIGLASSLVDSVLQGGKTSVGETGDVKKQD